MSHYNASMEKVLDGIGRGKSLKLHKEGKTARDHHSGSHLRCIHNKQTRASWQNDSKRDPFSSIAHTCNGKRNRYKNADTI